MLGIIIDLFLFLKEYYFSLKYLIKKYILYNVKILLLITETMERY
jgi:hypothetical protein